MKRILSLIMLVSIVGTTSAFAAFPAGDRVTGGLKDVVTSPLQVTDNVRTEMTKSKIMPVGALGGALKGTFYMGKQIIDGAYRVVSTPYEMIK